MKDKILEAVQISKTYGEGESAVQALKASDLTIWKGEFASIIGSSGSGKSTLLKILGGLLPPTTGNVLLDGQDIYAMNAEQLAQVRRQKIGFIFQDFRLFPEYTVRDNILLPLLRPAILSALIYSFVRAITTVSAIVFLVTPDTRVATAYILNRVEDGEYGVAIAYGSILIVVMLAIIFIFDWLIGESRTSRSKAKNQA